MEWKMNETSERMLEKRRARQRGTHRELVAGGDRVVDAGEQPIGSFARVNKTTSDNDNYYYYQNSNNNNNYAKSVLVKSHALDANTRLEMQRLATEAAGMMADERAHQSRVQHEEDERPSIDSRLQQVCNEAQSKCIINTNTTKKSSESQQAKHSAQNKRRPPVAVACGTRQWLAPLVMTAAVCVMLLIAGATALSSTRRLQPGNSHNDWHRSGYLSSADELRGERVQRDTNQESSAANNLVAPTGAHQVGTCGYPGSPAHASVTFNTTQVVAGTAASYTCDNGYELLGPPRRLCQANGTWSPVGIPFCVLNVGLGKAAMQSSTAGHGSAQKAVDGSTSPYFQASTCTMTDVEQNPWWYVNLLEPYLVQIVRIDFGTACCANRQKATIAVRVGNHRPDQGNNQLCNRYQGFIEEGKPLFLPCTRPAAGAFVSIHLESPKGSSLSICETFIYTDHALSIEQCPSFRDQPLGSTATYNGKCYLFHNNQALSFDNARKYCESRGGSLVDETSPALQGFLSWELYRRHRNDQVMGQYWLGAVRDARQPQNWKWINGKDVQISFWSVPIMQNNCSRFDGSKGWLWSDSDCQQQYNFICQYRPLSCGKPEKPTNSTLITKNVDNGTVIEYQCAPGNLLMGPKSRACLPTGFFSEFAPKCKYLDCQFPAMIPNGDYKLLNGTTSYQSVVNYYCDKGFQLYGKATLACDVDERWNGPPPRCEPLLCPAPVPPTNGYVTVTSNVTVPGAQATYDCRPGYELVGDHLLTCTLTGSWDFSFPYCRANVEKRLPLVPQMLPGSGTTPAPAIKPAAAGRQQQVASTTRPSNMVQFPTAGTPFASNRIAASTTASAASTATATTTTTASSTTTTTTSTAASPVTTNNNNSPASLNGLAGQFLPPPPPPAPPVQVIQPVIQQAQPPVSTESVLLSSTTPGLPPTSSEMPSLQQTRNKLNQLASLSPQAGADIPLAPPMPTNQQQTQAPLMVSSTQQPPRQQQFRPQSNNGASAATSLQSQFVSYPTPIGSTPAAPSGNNRQSASPQPTQQVSSKFGDGAQQRQPPSGNPMGYDSSPLATSNAISVHSQQPTAATTTIVHANSTTASATTTTSGPHHHLLPIGGQSVLASFSPPVRAHANLASAKYSLDGIIAVAIFGGFIFLGAIITIIVIIIRRRKSGHSSSIDAQTISTYDSNGDTHNGLYRNYQQAWENLRFATPNSHPKSSGAGLVSVGGVGPAVGLKNFGSPGAMAMATHQAHHLQHAHLLAHAASAGGHHNLAMSNSGSGGSTSSGSSSLGASGGGIDPLLAPHRVHSHAHQLQRVSGRADQLVHHHHDDDDDDDDDDDEQGVLASDEIGAHSYRRHSGSLEQHHGEGFRDSDELTINAEVAAANGQRRSQQMFSTNSIGRRHQNSAAAASGPDSHRHRHGHHHHHHHHHHHRSSTQDQAAVAASAASGGSGSSQHQRLVSSSTPSNSTRSSRASPPSDDHSLEQLAYGNSWHPNGSAGSQAAAASQSANSQGASNQQR